MNRTDTAVSIGVGRRDARRRAEAEEGHGVRKAVKPGDVARKTVIEWSGVARIRPSRRPRLAQGG